MVTPLSRTKVRGKGFALPSNAPAFYKQKKYPHHSLNSYRRSNKPITLGSMTNSAVTGDRTDNHASIMNQPTLKLRLAGPAYAKATAGKQTKPENS